jgi:hypothetical protein
MGPDARAEEAFLLARLEGVRPCAARPEYIELCFGPYGVHAYLLEEDGLGPALEISARFR